MLQNYIQLRYLSQTHIRIYQSTALNPEFKQGIDYTALNLFYSQTKRGRSDSTLEIRLIVGND